MVLLFVSMPSEFFEYMKYQLVHFVLFILYTRDFLHESSLAQLTLMYTINPNLHN